MIEIITWALGGFGAAYILTTTHGPFGIFESSRTLLNRFGVGVLECMICTAVWTTVLCWLIPLASHTAGLVLAAIGAAILLIEITGALNDR